MEEKKQPKTLSISVSDTLTLRESSKLKSFIGSTRKFVCETISGWFPSYRKDLSPNGVQKERVIDRKNDGYKEYVVDIKTGRVLRDIDEKLTGHRK